MLLWIIPIVEFFIIPLITLLFTILAKGVSKHNTIFSIQRDEYLVCFDLLVLSMFIYMVNMGKTFNELQKVSKIIRNFALDIGEKVDPELLQIYADQEKIYESKLSFAIPIALILAVLTVILIFTTKSNFARKSDGTIKWNEGIIFPNIIAILALIFVSFASS